MHPMPENNEVNKPVRAQTYWKKAKFNRVVLSHITRIIHANYQLLKAKQRVNTPRCCKRLVAIFDTAGSYEEVGKMANLR